MGPYKTISKKTNYPQVSRYGQDCPLWVLPKVLNQVPVGIYIWKKQVNLLSVRLLSFCKSLNQGVGGEHLSKMPLLESWSG